MLELKLSGEELLKLIDSCGKSRVSYLRLGELELTFFGKADPTEVPVLAEANPVLEQAVERESFAKAEADIRKERLESMILEAPEKFESLLASGDLVDDETTED